MPRQPSIPTRRRNPNSRASTVKNGRQYAIAHEGTVITFECDRQKHLYRIDFSKGPVHRRLGAGAVKMMASWWSREKNGCIGECPTCERLAKKQAKQEGAS